LIGAVALLCLGLAILAPFAMILRSSGVHVEPQDDALFLIEACSFVAASLPHI
jgi:hypothetical protein